MFDFVLSALSLYFKTFATYFIFPIIALAFFATVPCILRYFLRK